MSHSREIKGCQGSDYNVSIFPSYSLLQSIQSLQLSVSRSVNLLFISLLPYAISIKQIRDYIIVNCSIGKALNFLRDVLQQVFLLHMF